MAAEAASNTTSSSNDDSAITPKPVPQRASIWRREMNCLISTGFMCGFSIHKYKLIRQQESVSVVLPGFLDWRHAQKFFSAAQIGFSRRTAKDQRIKPLHFRRRSGEFR